MGEFDSKDFFKQIFGLLLRISFPLVLAGVIAGISWQLIQEAGAFFGSTSRAFYLEAGALALIAWRPTDWLKLVRASALLMAFSLVIAGSGFHSARPYLEADGLNPADRMKLQSMEDSIRSYEAALAAVAGQPRNSATAGKELRDAIAARDRFLSTVEPDAGQVAANRLAVLTAVAFRLALQSINWLLAHWLFSLILLPKTKGREDRGMGQLIALPVSKQPLGENESKLYEWIRERGEATRAQIFQSKKLAGQEAYDGAIDVLIRTGALVCEAKGPMAGWKYRAVDIAAA